MDVVRGMEESSYNDKVLQLEKCYALFIDFVHQSNLWEYVGTETREETTELLEPLLRKNVVNCLFQYIIKVVRHLEVSKLYLNFVRWSTLE